MTIAITLDKQGTVGSKQPGRLFVGSEKVRRGTLNLGVYATNGVAVTPATFELRNVRLLDLALLSLDGSTVFVWDAANGKVKAFSAVGTEVVNGTNLASKIVRFEVRGT